MMNIVGDTFESESIRMIRDISEAEKNSVRAKDDATYYTRVSELMYENYVGSVRAFKTFWDTADSIIEKAWSENQLDKKKKSEREQLIFLEYKIKEVFFKNKYDVKITSILSQGMYERYGWSIHLLINGKEYEINIPIRQNLTVANFVDARRGQFVFFEKQNDACWSGLKSAYTEEEIADWIEEYFKKQGVDEDA